MASIQSAESFWKDREPHLVVYWDPSTFYKSGFETDSWWRTRLHQGKKHVTTLFITGWLPILSSYVYVKDKVITQF